MVLNNSHEQLKFHELFFIDIYFSWLAILMF